MITLTNAGSRITANAANVATQMGGGTTTAEAQAIGAFLTLLAGRNDLAQNVIQLMSSATRSNIAPT